MWIPVLIRSDYLKPVIFGGGRAACMKAAALCRYGVQSVVVCPEEPVLLSELDPKPHWICSPYGAELMADATLVIAATDDAALNRQIREDAEARGIPALNAAHGHDGSLCFQRSEAVGDITVSVFTGGASPSAGAGILEDLVETLNDRQWPERIRLLGEIRTALKKHEPDHGERTQRMRELSAVTLEELRKRRREYED